MRRRGEIQLDVVGVAGDGDVEDLVYVVNGDDNSFTTTAGGNILIGKVARYLGTGGVTTRCMVFYEATVVRSAS